MKKICLFVCAVVFSVAVWAATPKNVILFIGDGMSGAQRDLAAAFLRETCNEKLAMNEMPCRAEATTASANSRVTDSAAAATAIACGEKTNNSILGLAPDGTRLESCAEVAKKKGRKVGLCTTVTSVHATPAGFYAHQIKRFDRAAVAKDLVASDFDFIVGGGYDACKLAEKAGWKIVKSKKDFLALKPGDGKILTGFTGGNFDYAIKTTPDSAIPSLAQITAKAIEMLDNDDGFFLMVEGGLIDWACHANDAAMVLRETLSLEYAVREALKFQEKAPDETLIIVTGDHETGGLSLATNGTVCARILAHQTMSADDFQWHAQELVKKNKKLTFAETKPLLKKAFGFVFADEKGSAGNPLLLTKDEERELEKSFIHDLELHLHQVGENPDYTGVRRYLFGTTCRKLMSRKAGFKWATHSHTERTVMTTAKGPGADKFVGTIDNTDFSRIIKSFYDSSSWFWWLGF